MREKRSEAKKEMQVGVERKGKRREGERKRPMRVYHDERVREGKLYQGNGRGKGKG